MRIAYITSESYLDHSYTIIKELKKNADIAVYLQAKELTEEIQTWCRHFDAKSIKRKRYRNPFSFFSELRFLLEIRKIKADTVWFNTLTAYQVLIAKLLFRNMLVMVHDVEIHPETKDTYTAVSLRLTFAFLKKKICVASKVQAKLFEQKYGIRPKVFQLPIIDYYTEIGEQALSAETKGTVKFFFFGSIEPYKGIETLLEASEILENKNADIRINIFGKLKYNTEEISKRAGRLTNTKLFNSFIPYEQVHKIFCENDVLILPYRQVTQCGPLLIGYSELVPSVCSRLEGFEEYVDDGKSGLLFDNTSRDLAEKMMKIAENPQLITQMKGYIKKEIFSKFSMESLRGAYINNLKTEKS